jgi:hypothetical protein
MEIANSSNYRQTGGGSMIVNIQDFYSFLKKIANSLRSFSEVIALSRARSDDGKNPTFHFQRLVKNKFPELNCYRSVSSFTFLFYLIPQKVYSQKNCYGKQQITQLIIFSCVLINICQIDFVNII